MVKLILFQEENEFGTTFVLGIPQDTTVMIAGMISLSKVPECDDDLYAVTQVASKPNSKLGPILYDVGMAWAYDRESWIMSDRTITKPRAKTIWKYYNEQRADVLAKPLAEPNLFRGHIETPEELEYLNNAYTFDEGMRFDYSCFCVNGEPVKTGIKKVLRDAQVFFLKHFTKE